MAPSRFFRPLFLFLAFIMIGSTFGCYSSSKLPLDRINKTNLEKLDFFAISLDKSNHKVWQLSNVKIEKHGLSARFERVSDSLQGQVSRIYSNRDRRKNQNHTLIYIRAETAKTYSDTLTTFLNENAISSIWVVSRDPGKVAGIVVAATLGTLLTLGIVALSSLNDADYSNVGNVGSFNQSDCNCPHVFTESPDGTQYLEGSLYSGAIYPTLERGDYLPLKNLQPINNQYKIRLANQEKQHQHTNFVSLEVLDHAPGVQPVFDKYGQLHTVISPQSPIIATNDSGQDVLSEVVEMDEKIFLGDLENTNPDATERLTLTFVKPTNTRQAKLVLNAKNNDWLDYTYYQFQNSLGQYANEIARKRSKASAAKNLAWAERQKIPLAVWLETTPEHWEKIDYFNLVGTSAFRQDVLSLDLSHVQGDTVRLRLEFGFHFWEIDYAALDFSDDQPVNRTTLRPVSATSQNGENLLIALTDDDDRYYNQPNIGDEANIIFEVPPLAPNQVRHLVVHAKGHYEIVSQPAPGRPRLSELKSWDKENALPRLSRERWQQMNQLAVEKP